MRPVLIGFVFLALFSSLRSLAGIAPLSLTPRVIRVRVLHQREKAHLKGLGLHFHPIKSEGVSLGEKISPRSEWRIQCDSGQIHLSWVDSNSVKLEKHFPSPLKVQSEGEFMILDEHSYRGELRIYSQKNGCSVVNHLDLESYLIGVVNSEFSSRWSQSAVAAQVIAARTYALYQMQRAERRHSWFDVDSTIRDQVYRGAEAEDQRAADVVSHTRGLILTSVKKVNELDPIPAFYHSICGGKTELPERVWNQKHPSLRHSVVCSSCQNAPQFYWQTEITERELISRLREDFSSSEGGRSPLWDGLKHRTKNFSQILKQARLLQVQARKSDTQGRVDEVIFQVKAQSQNFDLPMGGAAFREWIGFHRVKSTWFDVRPRGDGEQVSWVFRGRGNGHGVGLCQWGAKRMGESGLGFSEILAHYYPDAKISKVW